MAVPLREVHALPAVVVGAGALLLLGLLGYRDSLAPLEPTPPPTDRPIQVVEEDYVTSDTCRACHAGEYETWHASYHRSMTQLPSAESVIPAWDGTVLQQGAWTYTLSERDGEYWIETDDPDWAGPRADDFSTVERPLALITGSHNFQIFWTPSGDTRSLAIFPMAWSILEERWVPIDSIFILPPNAKQRRDDGRWNVTCIRCHSTGWRPRIESETEMDTHVAEMGIACEACHGPAEEHVAQNHDPLRRLDLHGEDEGDPTIVNPERLSPRLGSMVCGNCHSVTRPKGTKGFRALMDHGYVYEAGDELEHRHREFIQEGETQFWSDGMIRVSGREYNGLVTSPCYTHGDEAAGVLSCMSCHQLHHREDDPRPVEEWRVDQLGPDMDGNRACTQCHGEYAEDAALARHSHHHPASTGSSCYNCHMPHTTWGAVKAIRSHEVSSPSARATQETGRPNACNLCHLDRSLGWAAEAMAQWYGHEVPELTDDERDVADAVRWTLIGDAGHRALLSWHFGWEPAREASGEDWMPPFVAELITDPYDAVRNRAVRTLRTFPGFEDFDFDSEAPRDEREPARLEALERWSAGWTGEAAPRPETLLAPDGALREEERKRLLGMRDRKRMTLVE